MSKRIYLIAILFCLIVYSADAQTEVVNNDDGWSLIVDGKPFDVKGATFGFDKDVKNYDRYFKDLNFLGVNTIRLWATNDNTSQLLDVAHSYGIKVMVGIWMRHGRPGMEDDDSFDYLEDVEGMEDMYSGAISVVEKYKDHPAVLTWGIGNEVYLNMATDEEKKAYSILLERICSDIKKIDSNHLIVSVEAWTFGLEWWEQYVPSIDIYGLNSYGAGVNLLADELKKRDIEKPYLVTEFGVTGEWDIKAEKNGIKIEPSDQEKYNAIAIGYHEWIKNKSNCLGVYVFHYADWNDFLSSWLMTHHDGMYRPQYWAIREAFTGKKPIDNVPEIINFQLPDSKIESGNWVPVTLEVNDVEDEELGVSFYYNQRTGSRKRRSQLNKLEHRGNILDGFEIQMPKENGAIKVYVNVNDTYQNVGIASTSIVVIDEASAKRKYLVAKAKMPFYVYKDGIDMPYTPSGYMGNVKAISVDLKNKEDVHSGESSMKIGYDAFEGWYGLALVDPPNDWGDNLGGFDITGAKKMIFWAKASRNKVKATIGFGLIDKDKPFPDSSKKSIEIKLGKKWKKYAINLKKMDLSYIRSGLVIFSSASSPQDIFIDDVVFE